jgi:hypothetical protein
MFHAMDIFRQMATKTTKDRPNARLMETFPITREQEELLLSARKHRVLLDEIPTRMDDVRDLIARGYLILEVVIHPWGLEWWLIPAQMGAETSARIFTSVAEGNQTNDRQGVHP